jgi:hypothetical protein
MSMKLIIRDGSPDWWESTDIWVVPGPDPNGAIGTPVVGQPAYLWANVTNDGTEDASQVKVDFWVANPSLQIRKSTANHIGAAFADVAVNTTQSVLCLVPWNVTLINGGHECVVVEASSPADPLSPPLVDPDVLDAPTYRQIAQRNLSVATMLGHGRHEIIISLSAGARVDKTVEVNLQAGGELSREALVSLGLRATRYVGPEHMAACLSTHSQCGMPALEESNSVRLHVPRGQSSAVYLDLEPRKRLKPDEYAVVRVVERDRGRVCGGLSVAVVDVEEKKETSK